MRLAIGILVCAITVAGCQRPATIAVAQRGSVVEFPTNSNGNVAPSATISGPDTGLGAARAIASDSIGSLRVGSIYFSGSGLPETAVITSYVAGANGNSRPIATITGPHTGLANAQWISLALDARGNIYAVASPIFQIPPGGFINNPVVMVFARGADGDQAPIATIAGNNTQLVSPTGIALDGAGRIYVLDTGPPSINVYAAGAKGNVAPIARIAGAQTGLNQPSFIAVDRAGAIYVIGPLHSPPPPATVLVFAPGANGNVPPQRTISGPGLGIPAGICLDARTNIYVAELAVSPISSTPSPAGIAVFPPAAGGNATPSAIIAGSSTSLGAVAGITIIPPDP